MCKNDSVCLFEGASYLVLNFRAFNSLGRFLVLCHSTYYKVEGFLGGVHNWGFLSRVCWLCYFGFMVWQNIMAGSMRWEQSSSPVARQEAETGCLSQLLPLQPLMLPGLQPTDQCGTHTGHNFPPSLISLEASSQTHPARAVLCRSPAAPRSNQGHKMNCHSNQGR